MRTAVFGKAVPRTLRSEVVDLLREAIVSGRLQPGEHLKENEIAEQMQVSRSPVREAFRQLEQEGLIESVPNQGSYVKTYDAKEIEEIFTLRAALENLACELVITGNKLTVADWEQMVNLVELQRQAVLEEDVDRLTKLDMDFHEFICRKAGSQRLLNMWRSLRGQIQVLFFQRFQALDEVPQTVGSDHATIMAALRQGDVDHIAKVNKAINARVAKECIDVFQSRAPVPPTA